MKSFFTLFEELTDEQKKTVDKWGPNTEATQISSHVFPEGHDRVEIPLKDASSADAPDTIKQHLDTHGYQVTDYKSGLAKDKYGRETKIGKVLEKTNAPDELKKTFASDPNRATSTKQSNLKVVISKHPHDVAGMSTDRGWSSCMDMEGGCNRHYLSNDIKHGTHVAYLVNKDDNEIKNPIARIAMKPFVSDSGHTVIRPEESQYGTSDSAFHATVHDFAEKNYPMKDAAYSKHEALYNDSGKSTLLNIKNGEDAYKLLSHSDPEIQSDASAHEKLNSDFIDKAISDPKIEKSVKYSMIKYNPNINENHLSNILNDKKQPDSIKVAAITNKAATKEHISRALDDDQPEEVGKEATRLLKKHGYDSKLLDKIVDHKYASVKEKAAVHAERLNNEQLDKLINDKDIGHDYKRALYEHGKMSSKQLMDIIKNPDINPNRRGFDIINDELKESIFKNKNIQPEHVSEFLNQKPTTNAILSLLNTNSPTPEHLSKILDHDSRTVKYAALSHKNANKDVIIKGLKDKEDTVRTEAKRMANAVGVSKEEMEEILKNHEKDLSI